MHEHDNSASDPLTTLSLRMALATRAFQLIDGDSLHVTAQLDASKPETVTAFTQLQDVLMMAYAQGRAQGVGQVLEAFRAGQLKAGIPEEDLMPEDPVAAVTYLIGLVPEWR